MIFIRTWRLALPAALLGALSPYLGGSLQAAGLGESELFYLWFHLLPTPGLQLIDPSPTWAIMVLTWVYAVQWAALLGGTVAVITRLRRYMGRQPA